MDGKIYAGYHDVIIRTSKDVFKVQLIDADGNTRTFDKATWTPVEDGDELVWTVKTNFYLGNFSFGLRTRAVFEFFFHLKKNMLTIGAINDKITIDIGIIKIKC